MILWYAGYRKKSPPHQGVIYLVMPKDLAGEGWEESLSSRTNKTRSERGGGDSIEEGEEMCELGEEEEEEREQSLSVPASPTLTRRAVPPRRIRLRSQSFDDIISGVNNDDSLSPPSFTTGDLSTTTTGDLPAVHVSARNFVFETTPPLDSGSDSGTEPLPRHGLGVAYDHTHLISSQPEMTSAEPSSSSWRGGGRLNQLRGKFLGRVRRGQSQQKTLPQEVPLQPMRPRSHHVTSDCGPDTGGREEDTPTAVEDTITTASIPSSSSPSTTSSSSQQQPQQQGSLVANRLLAVGQRFRNAPPTLLRRMGVVGGGSGQHHMIQAPPPDSQLNSDIVSNSGEDIQRKSNSNFISL